ncbi:MAG: hypothetical protein O7H41_21050 [Planctomycetota bacterium]|nr:hypothetical protein [Planctomycetota bacterium]
MRHIQRFIGWSFVTVLMLMLVIVLTADRQVAEAHPGFSRKYKTSCTTCHVAFPRLNDFGNAFRMNGYQLPEDDDFYVKEVPVSLGAEGWKEVFPQGVWPNSIPGSAPIGLEFPFRVTRTAGQQGSDGPLVDFNFPTSVGLITGANLGSDLAFWGRVQLGEEVEVERAFLVATNLGMNLDWLVEGGIWDGLPPHLLNVRVGRMEPGAIPFSNHYWRLTLAPYALNSFMVGENDFTLEPSLSSLEAYGSVAGRVRYVAGLTTGTADTDNNSEKDFYGRLAFKIGGIGFDGSRAGGGDTLVQTQNWTDNSFTLGTFGYYGTNRLDDPAITGRVFDDRFYRFGFDGRLNLGDFDLFGAVMLGKDSDLAMNREDVTSEVAFVELDWVILPWLISATRFEYSNIEGPGDDVRRIIPSITVLARANVKFVVEGRIPIDDKTDEPDIFQLGLNVAF